MPGGSPCAQWIADGLRDGSTPHAAALAPPAWVLRALVLLWVVWVIRRLRAWLPWAWESFVLGSGWQLDPTAWWKVSAPGREKEESGSILDLGGPPPSLPEVADAGVRPDGA